MGKINLKVISNHLDVFLRHLNDFKQNGDGEAFKAAIGAIHSKLEDHGHNHIIEFFHGAAKHIQEAIKFVEDGMEDIAEGLEGLKKMLTHVATTAAAAHEVVASINPDAAAEMEDTMQAIHKIHKTVNKVDKIVDQLQEVADVVTGGDEDKEAAAVVDPEPLEKAAAEEDTDAPKVEITTLPEVEEGGELDGDELSSPKAKVEEEVDLKELPGDVGSDDAGSDAADDGDDSDDEEPEFPAVDEKGADLGDDFVGEGGDMPAPEAPAVDADPVTEEKVTDLGDEFTGLEGSMVAPATEGTEEPEVPVVGDMPDLGASVVSI